MGDDAQRARRRAHNAAMLSRCNVMGRMAGSFIWQPMTYVPPSKANRGFYDPSGTLMPEPPIEWRSEKLETILDELEETQRALAFINDAAPSPAEAYVNGLDMADWKAAVDEQFNEGAARLHVYKAGDEIIETQPVIIGADGMVHVAGAFTPEPGATYTLTAGDVLSKLSAHIEAGGSVNDTISLDELERTISKPAGMKFWFDTEFIEDGKTIDLLSIGVVCEDGRTYYAESNEWIPGKASQWVNDNVLPHMVGGAAIKPRDVIASDLIEFMGEEPEIWAYYADYDWVVLCQLFGTMMQLPEGWPMYCRDLKQMVDELGNLSLPPQSTTEHHALNDAIWTKDAWLHASQWRPK